MRSYKTKQKFANYIVLLFVLFCFAFDVNFFRLLLNCKEQIIHGDFLKAIVGMLIVLPFTSYLIFLLLNAFPKKISVVDKLYEITFFCGNKIEVNPKEIKVIQRNDYGSSWDAVLFMHCRFVSISSESFPHIKEIIYSNGKT